MNRLKRFGNKAKSTMQSMARVASSAIALAFVLWLAVWLIKASAPVVALLLLASLTV